MRALGRVAVIAAVFAASAQAQQPNVGIQRERFALPGTSRYLVVEALDDDLVHFELAENASGPSSANGIYSTPMVDKRAYAGPTRFQRSGNVIETAELRVTVEPASLCLEIRDIARGYELTRICGFDFDRGTKTLEIDPKGMRNAYGVGNFFYDPNSADGDWAGRSWSAQGYGNVRAGFHGAAPSMSQFPIVYALGQGTQNFGLFLDTPYPLSWEFNEQGSWWAHTWGDQLRFYVMAGPSLRDLRRDFMELSGKPLVPPKSVFGLWVSEFGYDNWQEVKDDLASLRQSGFPIDGFGMDLQWFGGKFGDSSSDRMGSLQFGDNFQNAEFEARRLRDEEGVKLMLIEESYVDERLRESDPTVRKLYDRCWLARNTPASSPCDYARFTDGSGNPLWWGRGGMIDWTDPEARAFWHQAKRHELAKMGITAHWTDLGEPEMYFPNAYYRGVGTSIAGNESKNRHGDIHNLYNFEWLKGISEGYLNRDNQKELSAILGLRTDAGPRHFSMSRAGGPGIQRFGAGMWSGDVGRNMGSLRAHLNSQMHMSLAGLDYYTSDAGGFTSTFGTGIEPGHTDAELYKQWYANSALTDIPLRPHGWAYGGDETRFGPDSRGDHIESNLANTLQRYELVPYYYSLAHRAHRYGEPMIPPPVYYFQSDERLREAGNLKMIGPSLLTGVVAGFGQTERPIYLPEGKWINYHSNEWIRSRGQDLPALPLYRERDGRRGIFTLPLFARSGAILPMMHVDRETLNAYGKRKGKPPRSELKARVFADAKASAFALYEDDGESLGYQNKQVRLTGITQKRDGNTARVRIAPAKGSYPGAPTTRSSVIELVVEDARGTAVTVDGQALKPCSSREELSSESPESAAGCWMNLRRNVIAARSASRPVGEPTGFRFELEPVAARASANFACENGRTAQGEQVYVLGNIPELGAWNPERAVALEATRYPFWNAVIDNLPTGSDIEWKCVVRRGEGGPVLRWGNANQSLRTGPGGYAGTTKGEF